MFLFFYFSVVTYLLELAFHPFSSRVPSIPVHLRNSDRVNPLLCYISTSRACNLFRLIHLQNACLQLLSFDTSMHTPGVGYPLSLQLPIDRAYGRNFPTSGWPLILQILDILRTKFNGERQYHLLTGGHIFVGAHLEKSIRFSFRVRAHCDYRRTRANLRDGRQSIVRVSL